MNAIEIKNLTKSYGSFTLDGLNLALPTGCIMGLIGENGAGKSTTIKLILNMIHRESGSITVLGHDNTSCNFDKVKEDIGVVLDEPGLPPMLKASEIDRIMKNIYKNWSSHDFKSYLDKLSVPRNKPFKDFSRGMQMKMGIAIALSHGPKLLILDEATSGLDPVIRDEVINLFGEFTRDENHSVLISSHIISDLEKICDYVAFLHNGKLILCEEMNLLYEEYCIAMASSNIINSLPSSAVIGKRETQYGMEAIIKREYAPSELKTSPIDIEKLFIFMSRNENI